MSETVPMIVTANAISEGNRAYRSLADPETYRPLWGEEAGDVGAGRRVEYRVKARVPSGLTPGDTADAFRAQDNVVSAEVDERAYGIPEPLPPRVAEVEPEASSATSVPETPSLRYAGLEGLGLDGAGAVHPKGVEVAVLDTGLDHAWAYRNSGRVLDSRQFTDEGHGAILPAGMGHYHGSHVAGSLVAGTRLRLNVAQVLGDDGSGYTSWIMDGLYWAVRRGCRVANLSLGGGHYSQAMADAVSYARRRGCLVVCAMGNDGVREQQYPAAYPGATAVIASSHRDSLRAGFSNYGEWAHGTTDGVNVLSWGLDGALVRSSGTSMSTPLYSRALALLIAEHGSPATALKVAGRTARDTPEGVLEEGNGAVDAAAAHVELGR